MNPTAELLAQLAPSLEAELRPRLQGFLGGLLRAYLPQTWVFHVGPDVASLVVAPDGSARVTDAAALSPDVSVELRPEQLRAALGRPRAASPGGPPPKVTAHTAKGRAAFDYLRPRLGL